MTHSENPAALRLAALALAHSDYAAYGAALTDRRTVDAEVADRLAAYALAAEDYAALGLAHALRA